MTPEEFAALAAKHGGQAGATAIDPYTKDEVGEPEKNYTPRYRITFKDGTHIEVRPQARWQDDAGEPEILGWDVTDWGTAEGPKAPKDTTKEPPYVGPVDDPRTRTTRVNPMSGDIQEYPGRSMGFYDEAGTLWKDPAASTSGPTVREIGGALYQWDPTSSSWQLAIAKPPSAGADNSVGWANLAQRQREFEAEAARQAAKDALDIERWNAAQTRQAEQDEWDKSRWGKEYALDRDKFAGTLSDQWTGRQIQATQYAVDPSWTSYPGFEAGGPVERLYRMGGSTSYTPPVIPKIQFDPIAAWRAAQSETRR